MAAVARSYGAVPVLAGSAGTEGGSAIEITDADAVKQFAATLSAFPAVCAVELSGRAESVDLVLEAVPRYARVLFAGPLGDRLTIDYYVNVHRKGMHSEIDGAVAGPIPERRSRRPSAHAPRVPAPGECAAPSGVPRSRRPGKLRFIEAMSGTVKRVRQALAGGEDEFALYTELLATWTQ